MDFITAHEAAAQWQLCRRTIAYHLKAGHIPGAVKKGKLWLIPQNAQRPADKRRKTAAPPAGPAVLQSDFQYIMAAAANPFPREKPDSILQSTLDGRVVRLYAADLAYLRGDFKQVMTYYKKCAGTEAELLRICPIAIAAAISLGDYQTYAEIESYLKGYEQAKVAPNIKVFAEFSLATAAVSALAPNMVPAWLQTGAISSLPLAARPNALYLRAKYFCCIGQFDAALAIAQTALTLSSVGDSLSLTDLYLRLICATACHALERNSAAEAWLLAAMQSYLPHGFITPFAELVAALGGLVERGLKLEFPQFYKPVLTQWERTWKNWISFHNQFTKENITLILSLREYQIAMQAARRVPYAQIARQHRISLGRLKNIMLEIHEKLCLSKREDLREFIL